MNFITGCLKAGVILTIISPAKKAFSADPPVDIAAGILEMSFIEDEKMSEQLLFSTTSTGAPEIQRRRITNGGTRRSNQMRICQKI